MTKYRLETWSSVTQAATSVATLVFAIWAFFFSSLSQKLEESFRTELNLAKTELIQAKREMARLELEHEDLAASTKLLSAEKLRLAAEISAAEDQLANVRRDRSNYATSTLALIKPQYVVLASYELALNSKVAEICSKYKEHRAWLHSAKKLASLQEKLEAPDQPIERRNEISAEQYELQEKTHTPEFWFGIPSRPRLVPVLDNVAFDALTTDLLNAFGDHNKFHQRASKWLMEQIVDPDGTRAITGRQFIERTKQYQLLAPLLPQEREAFNKSIDGFIEKHPEFQDVQINVTTPTELDDDGLVGKGKQVLPTALAFERAFLEHLKAVGIVQ